MENHRLNKYWLIGPGVIAIILLVLALVHDFMPEIRLLMDLTPSHRAELLTMIRSNGIRDLIFMLLLVGVMNAIPGLSNAVICVFVGLCYGPWIGLLVNWAGNILGNCAVAALLSHVKLSHKFKQNKILDSLTHYRHPALGLTVGYMVPIIPSVLVNYACATMKIPRKNFILMVAVGMFPTSALYALGGDALFKGNYTRLLVIVVLIVIILLLTRFVHQRRVEAATK